MRYTMEIYKTKAGWTLYWIVGANGGAVAKPWKSFNRYIEAIDAATLIGMYVQNAIDFNKQAA